MMLDRGILATGSFYAMWAHTDAHVDRYLEAVNEVFRDLRIAIDQKAVTAIAARPGRPFRIQAADLIEASTAENIALHVARRRRARGLRIDAVQNAVGLQRAAIDDDRARRHEGVVADRGLPDHAAAAIHHDAAAERRIVVVEVRADRAVVIADEVIRIARAAEHGADRMLDREHVGQLDLIERVQRVQRLVERIGLVRDGMAGLLAERAVGEVIQKDRILVGMPMRKTRLAIGKKALQPDAREAMLDPAERQIDELRQVAEIGAVRKQVLELLPHIERKIGSGKRELHDASSCCWRWCGRRGRARPDGCAA